VCGMVVIGCVVVAAATAGEAPDAAPTIPRIESVVPLPFQPHEKDPAVIWYDDFNGRAKAYSESSGGIDTEVGFGGSGGSMPCLYEKGKRGKGNRKVFFGDSPIGKVVRRGRKFEDVYWRIYVKHQFGWQGGSPAKMSRATSMVSSRWNQAMISHVWGGGETLTLDPVSGVVGDRVVTSRYNDFGKFKWLGNRPRAKFPIHSTAESGWWVCVEARAKLNAPGQRDGLNQLWLDGRLEAERTKLNWRGSYTGRGINAVFLEAYWNQGSPVRQVRWYDSFVISTKPIGPMVCPRRPTLVKTPYRGGGRQKAWQAEVAADAEGKTVVWQSQPVARGDRLRVEARRGRFVGPLAGKEQLDAGETYYTRVRQQSDRDIWSAWSGWHQCFATARQ